MPKFSKDPLEGYRSSGKVNWIAFLTGLVVTTGVAIVMSVGLAQASEHGFYIVVAAPFIAAVMTAGVWAVVLRWSQCRNAGLAVWASLLLALLLYVGHYYFSMILAVGWQNAHRIDLFPLYIEFRMRTDVVRSPRRPIREQAQDLLQQPGNVQRTFNWVNSFFDLIAVITALAGISAYLASRVYCESCGRWAKSESVRLPGGAAAAAWEALCHENYEEVQRQLSCNTPRGQMISGLTIEHCPGRHPQSDLRPVYLSLHDGKTPITGGTRATPGQKWQTRKPIKRVALKPPEVVALSILFPTLNEHFKSQPELFAEHQQDLQRIRRDLSTRPADWPHQVARVQVLESPTSRTILTTENITLQTLTGILPAFGGLVLSFAPVGIIFWITRHPPKWLSGVMLVWMFAGLLLTLGWNAYFPHYLAARFMRRRTRKAFAARLDSAVDLQNPELLFVDIVPRLNWTLMTAENASDIGFLEINHARRELIFEGDRERYWIPVSSILEVIHEFYEEPILHPYQGSSKRQHLIVVRAMTDSGSWEACFYRRHQGFKLHTAQRRLTDALELQAKILILVQEVLPPTAEH